MRISRTSFLFVTLDSCRYDTFASAQAPHLKRVGETYRAMAPGHNTFASHAAMFVGFTPGVPGLQLAYANPKFGRIFATRGVISRGRRPPAFAMLSGPNVVAGFRELGFETVGTGGVGWFDPNLPTTQVLIRDFDHYFFRHEGPSVRAQVGFVESRLRQLDGWPAFVFVNVGETHVPYVHEGATWKDEPNPCVPFAATNDAEKCRARQRACLEFVDRELAPLLGWFEESNVLVCGDHGDAWGEDGIWEHGTFHPAVFEVPLTFRLIRPPRRVRRRPPVAAHG